MLASAAHLTSRFDKGCVAPRLNASARQPRTEHQDEARLKMQRTACNVAQALQELSGEFGVFVEGGVEEALVGGEKARCA
jgi:hypothetical protein